LLPFRIFAAFLALSAHTAHAAECARMEASRLCRDVAARLPAAQDRSDWTLPAGCTADVAEADLGEGEWLFFNGARCNGTPLRLELGAPDPARGNLRPLRRAGEIAPLAEVTRAASDPKAQLLAIAHAGLPPRAAAACTATVSQIAGVPDGAWTVTSGDRRVRDDECGPFGAGASGDGYWMQVGSRLFFFGQDSTTGAQLLDPASFTVVRLADVQTGLGSP
jgi:hypothetical protein